MNIHVKVMQLEEELKALRELLAKHEAQIAAILAQRGQAPQPNKKAG